MTFDDGWLLWTFALNDSRVNQQIVTKGEYRIKDIYYRKDSNSIILFYNQILGKGRFGFLDPTGTDFERAVPKFPGFEFELSKVLVTKDENIVFVLTIEGRILEVDAKSGKIQPTDYENRYVTGFSISPDNSKLATFSEESGVIQIFSTNTGELLIESDDLLDNIIDLKFFDNKTLICASENGFLWKLSADDLTTIVKNPTNR